MEPHIKGFSSAYISTVALCLCKLTAHTHTVDCVAPVIVIGNSGKFQSIPFPNTFGSGIDGIEY